MGDLAFGMSDSEESFLRGDALEEENRTSSNRTLPEGMTLEKSAEIADALKSLPAGMTPGKVAEIVKEAPKWSTSLVDYLGQMIDEASEMARLNSSRAAIVERILLFAAGVFVLSMNFTTTAATELRSKIPNSHLSAFAHFALQAAWISLAIAMVACSVAWILAQFEVQRYEKIRQLNLEALGGQKFRSLALPVAKTVSTLVDQETGKPSVSQMISAIIDHGEKKNRKVQTEIEQMKFPAKLFVRLLTVAVLGLTISLLLLLLFALRVSDLLF